MAFSPNGRFLAFVGANAKLESRGGLWEIASGKVVQRFAIPSNEYFGPITFSFDGHRLLLPGLGLNFGIAMFTGHPTVLDATSGKPETTLEDIKGPAALSPDANIVAVPRDSRTIELRRAAGGKVIRKIEAPQLEPVYEVSVSGGAQILSVDSSNSLRVWDATSGRLIRQLKEPPPPGRLIPLKEPSRPTEFVVSSPDNGLVAFVGDQISVMESNSGKLVFSRDLTQVVKLDGEDARLHLQDSPPVAFSPDGRFLVSAEGIANEKTMNIWNINSGDLTRSFPVGWVDEVLFSSDGEFVISLEVGALKGFKLQGRHPQEHCNKKSKRWKNRSAVQCQQGSFSYCRSGR